MYLKLEFPSISKRTKKNLIKKVVLEGYPNQKFNFKWL